MFLRRQTLLALPLVGLLAGIAGCGSGPLAAPPATEIGAMAGVVHGGQSPIQGATVHLYHTDPTSTVYGGPAILIGSGTTDVNGNFTIGASATSSNCPAGTQAYITAAGGYQSGQSTLTNNEMLMMAALGDCATISSSTLVILDEVTTVAAAYALSSFITTPLDGSNTFYTANVSAPVANSTFAGAITATAPAGLVHAFQNAARLASYTTGYPNAASVVNLSSSTTAGTTTTTSGIVPYNEILTLADIMQTCVNSASGSNGAVASIPVSNGGSGYGATVTISGGSGTGATAKAIVSPSGAVTGLPIASGGSGYSPAITFSSTPGTTASVLPMLVNGAITAVTLVNEGTLYGPVVTITPGYAPGTGASIAATTSALGTTTSYVVLNGGSGYGPLVTFSAPTYGGTTSATATATLSGSAGAVTALTLVSGGAGYGPSVTITNPTSGSGATATSVLYSGSPGVVYSLVMGAGGSGYPPSSTFPITIQAPPAGTTATATATTNASGVVTGVSLTALGSGYNVPTVTIGSPTSGTTATDTVNMVVGGAIASAAPFVTLAGGTGYTLPTAAATGAGTGAVPGALTVVGGKISTLALGTAGSGYNPVTISPAPPTGTATTATVTLTAGSITALTFTAGTGSYGPTVTINGASTTAATATATVDGGVITALNLTAAGAGYGVPTVTVAPPTTGTTATATATTANGIVSAIAVTNGGSGYTAAPVVTLSAPTSGTTATAGTPSLVADSSTGTVAPSALCSLLFDNTPSISGNRPTNTLQAFSYLARNPYSSAAAVANLLTEVSSSAAFQPALTAAPNDWSLAITYNSGFNPVYWFALDASDTLYFGLTTTSSTLPAIQALSSYGVAVPTYFGAAAVQTGTRGIAPDTLGNIWVGTNGAALYKYSASSGGAPTAYTTLGSTYDVAVDAANNVWMSNVIASGTNIVELAYTPSPATWTQNYTASAPGGVYGLGIDANQNVWAATYYSSGTAGLLDQAAVLPNTGTVSVPNYNATSGVITPVTTTFGDGANKAYHVVFDASGNAWFDIYGGATTATTGIDEVIPNSTTNITSLTGQPFIMGTTTTSNGTLLNATVVNRAAMDGAGTMFIGDNTIPVYSLVLYNTVTGAALSPSTGITGCLPVTATPTTCTYSTSSPRSPVIDSAGTVWAGITGGGVSQFIGLAAPAYPQLSIGKPGLSPGLTAVNPLP